MSTLNLATASVKLFIILTRAVFEAFLFTGKPVSKKIEEATDILTFLYKTLDIDTKLQ